MKRHSTENQMLCDFQHFGCHVLLYEKDQTFLKKIPTRTLNFVQEKQQPILLHNSLSSRTNLSFILHTISICRNIRLDMNFKVSIVNPLWQNIQSHNFLLPWDYKTRTWSLIPYTYNNCRISIMEVLSEMCQDHLCPVTSVSMNRKPSNLGANLLGETEAEDSPLSLFETSSCKTKTKLESKNVPDSLIRNRFT